MVSLAWDTYGEVSTSLLPVLLASRDFSDVTLACRDGGLVRAHRAVLAASCGWLARVLATTSLLPSPT